MGIRGNAIGRTGNNLNILIHKADPTVTASDHYFRTCCLYVVRPYPINTLAKQIKFLVKLVITIGGIVGLLVWPSASLMAHMPGLKNVQKWHYTSFLAETE